MTVCMCHIKNKQFLFISFRSTFVQQLTHYYFRENVNLTFNMNGKINLYAGFLPTHPHTHLCKLTEELKVNQSGHPNRSCHNKMN